MTRVFVAVGEIIYQKIVFTKILSVTRANERFTLGPQCPQKKSAKSPAKGKPKQPKTKQGKKKKKDSRIKLLGT